MTQNSAAVVERISLFVGHENALVFAEFLIEMTETNSSQGESEVHNELQMYEMRTDGI